MDNYKQKDIKYDSQQTIQVLYPVQIHNTCIINPLVKETH